MKSDVININNQGLGFEDALEQTAKVAKFRELSEKETLRLQICTEEMLSLSRSVTGEMNASFWLESEGRSFDLHLSTKTVMDKEKRYQLISSASSRKNEAANSFLGKLRDAFEQAMAADVDHSNDVVSDEILRDVSVGYVDDPEWDRYEQSILRKLADNVKISIRGDVVDMTVTKRFD